MVQIPDVDADPNYKVAAVTTALGVRSALSVPMLSHGVPIGAITLNRVEPGDYPNRQVELLKTFADQAVIAIENVRLFDEVQARNREMRASWGRTASTSPMSSLTDRTGPGLTQFDPAIRFN